MEQAEQQGPAVAMIAGLRALRQAPKLHKFLVLIGFFFLLLMLPVGRSAPDAGGLLAPLTVDSGYLSRAKPGVDFYTIYEAGHQVLRGADPYAVRPEMDAPARAPYFTLFRYLPITALWLGVPLNILPPGAAFYTWCGLLMLLTVANFLLCTGRRPELLPLWILLWFGWFPTIAELHMGQFTLLLSTLLLWSMDGLRSGKNAGMIGWGMAVLLKVYPIGMAASLALWGRWRGVLAVLCLVIGSSLLWPLLFPSDVTKDFMETNASGRFVLAYRQPYAGSMGVQELTNAAFWKLSGRSFGDAPVYTELPGLADPVFLVNALIVAVYTLLCAWVLWKTRRRFSPAAIGFYWLAWFFLYADCWEHHYLLIQGLLGFLLAWKLISPRIALICWAGAGGPSLWWLWQRTGYAGNALTEAIGMLYFIQRPIAIVLLAAVLLMIIAREYSGPNEPTHPEIDTGGDRLRHDGRDDH